MDTWLTLTAIAIFAGGWSLTSLHLRFRRQTPVSHSVQAGFLIGLIAAACFGAIAALAQWLDWSAPEWAFAIVFAATLVGGIVRRGSILRSALSGIVQGIIAAVVIAFVF